MRTEVDTSKKYCTKCGSIYDNFCVVCRTRERRELVESLMDKHGLTEEEIIRILAKHVKDGSVPALNLAIVLKDMKPASKVEASGPGGGPIEVESAREAIPDLLSRIAARRREKSDN